MSPKKKKNKFLRSLTCDLIPIYPHLTHGTKVTRHTIFIIIISLFRFILPVNHPAMIRGCPPVPCHGWCPVPVLHRRPGQTMMFLTTIFWVWWQVPGLHQCLPWHHADHHWLRSWYQHHQDQEDHLWFLLQSSLSLRTLSVARRVLMRVSCPRLTGACWWSTCHSWVSLTASSVWRSLMTRVTVTRADSTWSAVEVGFRLSWSPQ